jgi:hypothetical protein
MRRKRGRFRLTEPKFHHNVYVILLSNAALKESSILRQNPKRDPAKPCIYVGMTGLPVDHRFENHKNGYKAARLVRKYGVRLMPELYEHLNPMPFEAAAQMERISPKICATRVTRSPVERRDYEYRPAGFCLSPDALPRSLA